MKGFVKPIRFSSYGAVKAHISLGEPLVGLCSFMAEDEFYSPRIGVAVEGLPICARCLVKAKKLGLGELS